MNENDKPRTPIHIQTTEDHFGKRTITLPGYAKPSKKRTLLAIFLAILIGVAVPYFLIDLGSKAYEKVVGTFFEQEKAVAAAATAPKSMGSDDADNVSDIPKGEQVFVNNNQTGGAGQYFFESPDYSVPRTSGLAYVVGDVDTGEVIISKNADKIFPIASISKLITALVAKQNMNQHDAVTVSRSSVAMYGTEGGLATGEKILVADLYYPLLMESSNDAAEVFAEAYGYDKFIALMNAKAKELGMNSTSFFEPSGLSAKNTSTATDLFTLAKYITKEHPEIWDITRVRQYSILYHTWTNGSILSHRSDFLGGKNGYTEEAERTTTVVLNVQMDGGPRRIAFTLLQSNDREGDVSALQRFLSKWVGFLPAGHQLNENN